MALSGTGLLAGLASAIPGAVKGYQDMKAQDLKQMELEAKAKADAEDRQYKKISAKLKAAELGQDLEENESGELVLKPRAGLLTPEQKRQEEMYMKGFTRDDMGNLKPADWKQQEIQNKGLLEQSRLGLLQAQTKKAQRTSEVGGKELSQNMIKSLNEANQIPIMLQDVESTIEQNKNLFDPIKGRLMQLNPYDTASQTVDAQLRAASQAFGRYMEGGVLRKEDEDKYRRMFPQLGDTPDVAQNKLQVVKRLLAQRQESDMQAFESQGYDLSGIKKEGMDVPSLPSRGLLPQAQTQAQPQTKVINGVTYRKVDGGWEAQE